MHEKSLYEVLKTHLGDPAFNGSGGGAFVSLIENMKNLKDRVKISELVNRVCVESGYEQYIRELGDEERLDNLSEFKRIANEFENGFGEDVSLETFLQQIAIMSAEDAEKPCESVKLMTIHASKGLEFPVVFILGFSEGIFPSSKTIEERKKLGLEEERRLFYVAMTRAKSRLFITFTRSRMLYGRTNYNDLSRFVKEIPSKFTTLTLYTPEEDEQETAWEGKDYVRVYSVPGFNSDKHKARPFERYPLPTGFKPESTRKKEPMQFFEAGDRVVHAIFGAGYIEKATKYGSDTLYQICFDHAGTKKLMATYAKLKREEE